MKLLRIVEINKMLDRIIFGDNQFFGINHMSEEKARELSEKFNDLKAIIDVIDFAYNSGIRGFMLNANERAKDICDYIRDNSTHYSELTLYPTIPYPHKYANLVAERGIFKTIKSVIFSEISAINALEIFYKGSIALISNNVFKGMELLIDAEMKIFQGLNAKVIFLHNILTDLLLGLGMKDIFIKFATFIREKYMAEPGFITQNLPELKKSLLECNIDNPIICSSINKIGYLMNPDRKTYERVLEEQDFRPVAMSIFASGAISPKDAIEYVCKNLSVNSIIFGASKKQHILETKELIECFIN